MMTGNFSHNPDTEFPLAELIRSIEKRIGAGKVYQVDASRAATQAFSDSIAANLMILGYAYQLGGLPLPSSAIERAIEIDGRAVDMNLAAFRLGRAAAARTKDFKEILESGTIGDTPSSHNDESLEGLLKRGEEFLSQYQDRKYGQRYRKLVEQVSLAVASIGSSGDELPCIVAKAYWKLLAYKDEYEVARLFVSKTFKTKLAAAFEPVSEALHLIHLEKARIEN